MLRNDDIVPRLSAGAGDGVTKMCAMQVVSWQNGDTKITDFPACSARPLARLVQQVNDRLAGPDGFLSPEDSVLVLDLGWRTVGTAQHTPRVVVWRWLADLLIDPEMGVVKYARPDGVAAIQRVAELCIRKSLGEAVSADEWVATRAEARKARAAAYADAAADAAADAYAAADAAAYAAADAAADAAAAAYAAAYAYAAADAAAAADADAAAYARIRFTTWAIERWRELAGLNTPPVDHAAVDAALARINA